MNVGNCEGAVFMYLSDARANYRSVLCSLCVDVHFNTSDSTCVCSIGSVGLSLHAS